MNALQLTSTKAEEFGIKIGMGHGLNYNNIYDILKISGISEFQIGQAIIARSIWSGLHTAIKDMSNIIKNA